MKQLLAVALVALASTSVLAQKTTLQLQDASGDRLIIETGTLTANRTTTLPDASGMLMVSGTATIDDLLDAKSGGANFTNSLLLGHQTTGTLNNAAGNTGVGYGTLQSITSASNNTAMGLEALRNTTSGNANTAVGVRALASVNTGAENTAIGHRAGENTTTAMMNTALGEYALRLNQSASEHTSVGAYSMYSFTAGGKNVAVGNGSLYNLLTGNQNTVVGADAGSNTLNASGNVFIGYAAGQNETASNKLYIDNSNTSSPLIYGDFGSDYVTINGTMRIADPTRDNYTAFAAQEQAANITYTLPATAPTTGQALVAGPTPTTLVWGAGGAEKIDDLTDAKSGGANFTNSLVLGHQNLGAINGADQNTGVGFGVIQNVSTGDYNTAFGYTAMQSVTTGEQNTAIGSVAMNRLTTGSANVAIGMYAMFDATTSGNYNTIVGTQAGFEVDGTAAENTAVGGAIFRNSTTGNRNTALGYSAMYNGGSGDKNTAVGALALRAMSSGTTNVALGNEAGYSTTTGSGNVFIGNQAGFGETGSNKLYIDNSSTGAPLIYGDFSSNNLTVNGALTLMAGTSDYGTDVDAANLTQTYLALGEAGTGNDYAYLRQIGGANLYHLALDFHDDANDARFSIRSVQSSGQNPDIITTRFVLDVNGRVGIGTDAPDYMLDVTTTVNQALGLTTTNNDVTGMLVMDVENAPAAGTGQNQEFVFFQTLGVTRGAIRYDGTNLLYENLSDYRLKEDLQPFNALSLVRQIPVYDFKWKQSEMRTYGFMAHELQATVPYLVSGEKDAVDDKGRPQYQMVDYSKLTPILTKAIQEQQGVIEQQQQTINDLKSRMERLERTVQALQEQK